ncbi:hypothetical protein BDP27DRAFT_1399800 [Rhodocollybia butyracea]|uniref:Uncharacterized protein n=1 Tax=Rhodocollybia butyracea TaxID=206335 RepID=A0A9P5UCL4_9AGAR|nr:hypothetical protein BDP27DRAFT_1399800 [Rhodocollybia butyracea]
MHISNQALTAGPSNQLHPEAIVRLIDGKTGEDLGSNVVAPAVIKGPTAALRSIFGKGSKVTFIGKYVPGQIRIYFRVIGPLGCDDKDNPCFGWMAKGPRYKLVPARPNGNGDIIESYARVNMPLDLWYVGLSSGRPALGHFDNRERGKPQAVPATVRDPKITEKMKLSWVQLLDEYKKSFMIPEVTFTTLPQSAFYVSRPEKDPKRKPKKEPKEELREELKKELNEALYVAGLKYGALHWPKDGSILYNGRYGTEVHDPNEPNLRWFFFSNRWRAQEMSKCASMYGVYSSKIGHNICTHCTGKIRTRFAKRGPA